MKVLIITGGTITDHIWTKKEITDVDYIIGVDGGTKYLEGLDIIPDIVLGDFDSSETNIIDNLKKKQIKYVVFPKEKDKTDTELAIDYAITQGASEIIIIGAIGTRLDHTLANLYLLIKPLKHNIKCKVINENNRITLINQKTLFKNDFGSYISIIPLYKDATGVSTEGLYYPLKDAKLVLGSSLGISNQFIENEAYIDVKDGLLLVIQSKD